MPLPSSLPLEHLPLPEEAARILVRRLSGQHRTIATAESCTGGLIAESLTRIPGASAVFSYGWVTYADEAKNALLGVPWDVLKAFGAVSRQTVCAMAAGARERAGADYAVAVSGIAGPGGGSPEKPVGTVWLAWARRDGSVHAERLVHPLPRQEFRSMVASYALMSPFLDDIVGASSAYDR